MDIDKRIDGILPMLTAFRRELHEYPDLSGEEQPTCARSRRCSDGTASNIS